MTVREKRLLWLLVGVVAFLAMPLGVYALSPAVGYNGISWTRTDIDTCPANSATCTHANALGQPKVKIGINEYFSVQVSPSPSNNAYVATWNNTTRQWYAAAGGGGGGGTFATTYDTGTAANNIIAETAAGGPTIFRDNATPMAAGNLAVQNSAGTIDYFLAGNGGWTATGPFAFGSSQPGGYVWLENTTAATGGVPLQVAPDITQRGLAWDGAASRLISVLYQLTGANGAGYTADWLLRLKRNATTVTLIDAVYDGSARTISLPGGTVGTDASNQHAFPPGTAPLVATDSNTYSVTGVTFEDDGFSGTSATTASTTFVAIGNGTTTGFADHVYSAPKTRTYALAVTISEAYVTGGSSAGVAEFRIIIGGVQAGASKCWFTTNTVAQNCTIFGSGAMTAGNNTLRVEWRVADSAGGTLNVDGSYGPWNVSLSNLSWMVW